MTQPTYAITANSLTAETFRQAPSSLISGTGVVGSGDLAVSQNGTPDMSVNVAAGQVWVPGTLSSTTGFPTNLNAQTTWGLPSSFNEQASYFQWYSGTTNLAISAADPTNPRIDLAVVSIQDAAYSGSNNQGILQIITGTPAPSPSAPSAPASSVVLAQIAVAAGASSIVTADITDERTFLALTAVMRGNPAARLLQSANQTISNVTTTQVNSLSQSFVYGGMVTSSNGISVPVAGVYRVSAQVQWGTLSAGISQGFAQLVKNGTGGMTGGVPLGSGTIQGTFTVSDLVPCAVNDYFTLDAFQSSGGSQTTAAGGTYLEAHLVSR